MQDPRKEQSWADHDDDADNRPDDYETTYRDGSLKNECWRDDRE